MRYGAVQTFGYEQRNFHTKAHIAKQERQMTDRKDMIIYEHEKFETTFGILTLHMKVPTAKINSESL